MKTNLAFIDSEKCKLCRKCVTECPTNAIIEVGFPPRKEVKPEENAASASEPEILKNDLKENLTNLN